MATSTTPETFEWPPARDGVADQIVEFRNGGVDSSQTLFDPPAAPNRATPRAVDPQGKRPTRQESKRSRIVSWTETRSRLVPIAAVILALTAVVEGVYIVSTLSTKETVTSPSSAPAAVLPLENESSRAAARAALPAGTAERTPARRASRAENRAGTSRQPKARLVVRSDPAGAQVFLDGRLQGMTPVTIRDVRAGEHQIVLKRDDREVKQTIRLGAGDTISLVAPMQPNAPTSGWLAIASPVELDVFENGALIGTSRTSQIMLEAGPHTLELRNDDLGYRHIEHAQVEAGQTGRITVALPQTTLNVNALPWADVSIDGAPMGQTPIGNLPIVIGTHQIVFRHPELGERTVSTTIRARTPARLTVDLRQPPQH